MTTLPHLFFANELLEALSLLPAPSMPTGEESTTSKNTFFDWVSAMSSILIALAALGTLVVTCLLFNLAKKTEETWEKRNRNQVSFDAQLRVIRWATLNQLEIKEACRQVKLLLVENQLEAPDLKTRELCITLLNPLQKFAEESATTRAYILAGNLLESEIKGYIEYKTIAYHCSLVLMIAKGKMAIEEEVKFLNYLDKVDKGLSKLTSTFSSKKSTN